LALVLDASACLPWCFQDESTPETERLFDLAISGTRLFVPPHWPAEMLNALTRAVRRGRIGDAEVDRFLDDLAACDIVVDQRPITQQWNESLSLIRTYQLSAYDAAYLALAKHLGIPLATADGRLLNAATIEGVPQP
jgi:predicted nucleic acid-binding protein